MPSSNPLKKYLKNSPKSYRPENFARRNKSLKLHFSVTFSQESLQRFQRNRNQHSAFFYTHIAFLKITIFYHIGTLC
jgi:hypothetical protein